MKSSSVLFHWIRRWGIAIGVTAFLVLVVLSYLNVRQFITLAGWVTHTNLVLSDLSSIATLMERAESSQRGYLLLGKEELLANYNQAKNEALENLNTLTKFVSDNPKQSQRSLELKELMHARFKKMEYVISLRNKNYSLNKMIGSIDTEIMANLRITINKMHGTEEQLLAQRTADTEAQAVRVLNYILVGVGLSLTLMIISRFLFSVADRERKQQALILNSILNSIGEGLVVVDQKGTLVLSNPASAKILGVSSLVEEMKDRAAKLGFYNPKTKQPLAANETPLSLSALQGQSIDDFEILIVNNSHQEGITINVNSRPIVSADGKTLGALALFRDITKRKNIEDEWQRARESAIEASRLKSEFLATMSHEIRTPMNGVIGMATMLIETKLDTDQISYVKTIKSSADSLLSLINGILDHSKIESGKLTLENKNFHVGQVIQSVQDMFSYMARSRSLQLNVESSLEEDLIVSGDRERLRQILINLVGNAFKFTERGFISIEVSRVMQNSEIQQLKFEVKDTGIGMSAAAQKNLFDPYTQVHSDGNEKYGGTGLGLTIARELVHLMKGTIQVESILSVGSRFWFTIEAQQAKRDLSLANPIQSLSFQKLKGRVLVAEDQMVNKTVVRSYLEKCGLTYLVTSDGLESTKSYFKEPDSFDLILMDCQMPKMNGYEATEKIREFEKLQKRKPITIIALTAEGRAADRDRCTESGMNDFLSKPIDLQIFNQTLAKWLPGNNSAEILDVNVLIKLSQFSSDGISLDIALIKEFFSSALPELETLTKNFSEMTFDDISAKAHSLKSSCLSLGLTHLGKLLEEIESLAESKSDLSQMVPQLGSIILQAKVALENYTQLKSPKAG